MTIPRYIRSSSAPNFLAIACFVQQAFHLNIQCLLFVKNNFFKFYHRGPKIEYGVFCGPKVCIIGITDISWCYSAPWNLLLSFGSLKRSRNLFNIYRRIMYVPGRCCHHGRDIMIVGWSPPSHFLSLLCSTTGASCCLPVGNKVQRILSRSRLSSSRLRRILDIVGSPEVPNTFFSHIDESRFPL